MNLSESVVLSYGKIFGNSYQGHNNIGRWLAKACYAQVIDDKESARAIGRNGFERMFFINSVAKFSSIREDLFAIAERHVQAGRPFYLCVNDYTIAPDGHLRRLLEAPASHLLGIFKGGKGWREKCRYINWNALTVWKAFPWDTVQRDFTLGYYGAFREGRRPYFQQYFNTALYQVDVMTSPHSESAFARYPACRVCVSTNLAGFLGRLRFALYLEDRATHTEFGSLANRYYECMSAGAVLLFDEHCIHTLEGAGIPKSAYAPYLVGGPEDVLDRLAVLGAEYRRHQETQRGWLTRYHLAFDPERFYQTVAACEKDFAFAKK